MRDLAPDIVRQRQLIEGYFTIEVDEAVIRDFLARLTTALALRTYDKAIIFAPAGEGRAENEGYDAFVPLIDSGISLYVWARPRFLSLVIFTCKSFDAATAREVTRDYFGMTELESSAF